MTSQENIVRFNREPFVLNLSGSAFAMGFAHGELAAKNKALDLVHFYASFLEHLLRFNSASRLEAFGRGVLATLLDKTLVPAWVRRIPLEQKQGLLGFAEGAKLNWETVARALVMPDVFMCLLQKGYHLKSFRQGGFLGQLGCTTWVTRNLDDKLVHARNLDFPGGRYWTQHPALLEFSPSDGQKYLAVSSLGVHSAGISAMNESGITLSLNMNYSRRVSRGQPILTLCEKVIQKAQTLKEALDILLKAPIGAGWSVVLSSGKENKMAKVELSPRAKHLELLHGGGMVATNHFSSPSCVRQEYWLGPLRYQDSLSRAEQVLKVQEQGAHFSMDQIFAVLRSTESSFQQSGNFGGTVSAAHTVSSLIFMPQEQRVFLACGDAPACHGAIYSYRAFATEQKAQRFYPAEDHQAGRLYYAKAFEAYFPQGNWQEALTWVNKSLALLPNLVQAHLLRAFLLMLSNQMKQACLAFAQAQHVAEPLSYAFPLAQLGQAWALDCLGQRQDALGFYEKVANESKLEDMVVRAKKGLKQTFRRQHLHRMAFDPICGEILT